ncbi:MAG: hypothetical protein QF566_03805 [Candidatus Thalassarchaeaceae archaeon]|nr:hypothetical protein [Candidatus Thalassarchaeaceae archaeon]
MSSPALLLMDLPETTLCSHQYGYPLVQPHTQGIDLHHGVGMISRAYVSV